MPALRRLTLLLLATLLATMTFLTVGLVPLGQPEAQAAPMPSGTPLLLIHGYTDTCSDAFESVNVDDNYQPYNTGPNAITARNYFQKHGWTTIDEVGYYYQSFPDGHGGTLSDVDCTNNAQSENGAHCQSLEPNNAAWGTADDPIKHIACLMAWYIYDHYSSHYQWVSILAHSMGGLVVRAAIGYSGNGAGTHHDSNFPPALKVRNVVTVGSPHGGLVFPYFELMSSIDNSREVQDMDASSSFMNGLATIQKPQGERGTYWSLMAAGMGCNSADPLGETYLSCQAQSDANYPWTDAIIQSSSALAMQADYKVLYGSVGDTTGGGVNPLKIYHADVNTEYRHGHGCTGVKILFWDIHGCTNPPFYLNDGTENPGSTRAWICWQNCNNTDPGAYDFDLNKTYTALHSLAQINSLLAPYTQMTSSALNTDGRMETFWCDNNHIMRHAYQVTLGGQWQSGTLQSAPFSCVLDKVSVGENADGRLEVFALSNANQIWHIWELPGTGWSNWSALPGNVYSAAGVGRNADGRLELFAVDGGNHIVHAWQSEPNGGIGNWSSLGSSTTLFSQHSTPTVISHVDGRLEVFGLSEGGSYVYYLYQTVTNLHWSGTWTNIESTLGSNRPIYTYSRIAANRNADGRIELYINGYQSHYWHIWQLGSDPTVWLSSWEDDSGGASFLNDPGFCTHADGRVEVFGTRDDYSVYHAWQTAPNGTWSSYSIMTTPADTLFPFAFSCLRNSNSKLEIVGVDSKGYLWHAWINASNVWNNLARI